MMSVLRLGYEKKHRRLTMDVERFWASVGLHRKPVTRFEQHPVLEETCSRASEVAGILSSTSYHMIRFNEAGKASSSSTI